MSVNRKLAWRISIDPEVGLKSKLSKNCQMNNYLKIGRCKTNAPEAPEKEVLGFAERVLDLPKVFFA